MKRGWRMAASLGLGGLIPSLGLPSQLLLVGGTNASIESIVFAAPTDKLTMNNSEVGSPLDGSSA